MDHNPTTSPPTLDRKLQRDLKLLARFIDIYCAGNHKSIPKHVVRLNTLDFTAIHGKPLRLCGSCSELLEHACNKRIRCPYDPKPVCRKCPTHCYAPRYRAKIKEVMRYAGIKLVLRGRLDYLLHFTS